MTLSLLILLVVVLLAALGIKLLRSAARREPGRVCHAPGCEHENRKDAKFCGRCGAPLND
jgi:rRNA maturation endonuclease Nob1